MEARVDLRTSTLVLGRTSYQFSGQEVERCAVIRRQPQAATGVSGSGLINPGTTHPDVSAESPIPGLNSGGSDIDSWRVVAHGPIVPPPPLSEGVSVGRLEYVGGGDFP
jgi:hypothetical protein